ncbi:hypothetical protein NBO_364g0012, partial [Nosema bombycis CQ1]
MKLEIFLLFLSKIKSSTEEYTIRIINVKETESIQRDKQLMGKDLSGFVEVVTSKQRNERNDQVVSRKNYELISEKSANETVITINSDCPESSRKTDSDDDHEKLQFNLIYSIENFLIASLKYFLIENEQNKSYLYFKMTCDDNPFTLYHYKSYKRCFWYLWTLSKKIKVLNFERNNFSVNQKMLSLFSYPQQSESIIGKLYERLCFKYESQLYDQMEVQLTILDLKNVVRVLINELSSVKWFFLITDTFTEEKYIEVFANMIIDLIKKSSFRNNAQQLIEYCNENMNSELNNLQYHIESELSTFDYLIKQVCDENNIYPRNDDDFKTLEKITCDFFNLCVYLLSSQSKTPLLHLAPANNYNRQFKLLKMAEIELEEHGFIHDVISFDSNGNETILKINKNVFVGRNCRTLYLSLDLMRELNTQSIKIDVGDDKLVIIDLKIHSELLFTESEI